MTTIVLPTPPSSNALYRNTTARERALFARRGFKAKMRVKTDRYATWLQAAGWEIKRQRPAPIKGFYAITVTVGRKSRADLNNLVKAVEDLLKKQGVIEDDKFEAECHLYWSDAIEGCRVDLIAVDQGRRAA